MTIYLDTCALGRLTDDLSQSRLRAEAEAVARILELVALRKVRWIASSVLREEISHNPYPLRRIAATELLSTADELVEPTAATFKLAAELMRFGITGFDAVHLATAEQAGAEALLTTDDRFVRSSARDLPGITVRVLNPVDWVQRRRSWLLP
jgi:predicted nucleic acid-binding protein